jgi:hypothetical protein
MGGKYGNGRFLRLFTLVKYERCEYSLDEENGMWCHLLVPRSDFYNLPVHLFRDLPK